MDGCQDARNAITIEEITCPKCGGIIEIFVKDGFLAADAICDVCGYVISAGSNLGEL